MRVEIRAIILFAVLFGSIMPTPARSPSTHSEVLNFASNHLDLAFKAWSRWSNVSRLLIEYEIRDKGLARHMVIALAVPGDLYLRGNRILMDKSIFFMTVGLAKGSLSLGLLRRTRSSGESSSRGLYCRTNYSLLCHCGSCQITSPLSQIARMRLCPSLKHCDLANITFCLDQNRLVV